MSDTGHLACDPENPCIRQDLRLKQIPGRTQTPAQNRQQCARKCYEARRRVSRPLPRV